jgi:hypothetical protein
MSSLSNHQHRMIRNAAASLAPNARAAFFQHLIKFLHNPRRYHDTEIDRAVRLSMRHVARRAFLLVS